MLTAPVVKAAIILLAIASAFLWTLPLWDRISIRGDDTDLAGSTTLTMTAVLVALNAVRERRDREARVRNLRVFMPILDERLTPHDGDAQAAAELTLLQEPA